MRRLAKTLASIAAAVVVACGSDALAQDAAAPDSASAEATTPDAVTRQSAAPAVETPAPSVADPETGDAPRDSGADARAANGTDARVANGADARVAKETQHGSADAAAEQNDDSESGSQAGKAVDPLSPPIEAAGDPLIDALAAEESGREAPRQYDLGSEEVVGQQREAAESGATFDIELGQLGSLPFSSPADVMMLAPGVLTTNHGGDGHAHETFLRGFYAGEGQDIEYMVDGVPLNEVSNPHGHGYTDLFFLPASWIKSMRLREGTFDPEQGDFAFAGSVNFVPGVSERGLHVQGGYGSFDTRRLELTWAPETASDGTFAGVQFHDAEGYGANRTAQRTASMLRYSSDPGGTGLRWSAMLAGYLGRYAQPNVLRADDVEDGTIGFFDTYDATQGGESARVLGSARLTYGPNDARFENVAWFGLRSMRIRQNFTGFLVPTETVDEGTVYLGDLQEGRYNVTTVGARGSYTLGLNWNERYQELSAGYSARLDTGRTELVRLRDRLDIPYARDFDRTFDITNVAGWIRLQSELTEWLLMRGGVRVDTFLFGVRDLNQAIQDTDGERLPEQTLGAGGLAINPRLSTTVRLAEGLRWTTAYGRGTRSTDAAALSDTENAPFATSDQVETGLKWNLQGEHRALKLQGSYVYAFVEQDLVFDPLAGRNVQIGSSQRHAVLFQGRYVERERFDILANVGWARATTEETNPTSLDFGETVLLPYVPQLVARVDATYRHSFDVTVGGVPLALRTTANFTYMPGRPLPLGETGDPFSLLGAAVELEVWHATLRVEGRNLLDRRYRQSEFNYPSRFDRSRPLPESGVPPAERHFVAGEPRFLMASVSFNLSKTFSRASGETAAPLDAQAASDGH